MESIGAVIRRWVWLECIVVVSRCCCKEVLIIDFLKLLIPTPLVLAAVSPLLCSLFNVFSLFNELRRKKKKNAKLQVFTSCGAYVIVLLWQCYTLIRLEITYITR